jgi:hypothetical protein
METASGRLHRRNAINHWCLACNTVLDPFILHDLVASENLVV